MTCPEARVIADSVSPDGHRLTTFQVTFHRFVLAEFNTHRVFSRNSASSRAIPVTKQLARFKDEPAFPLEWASEKPGMQGGPPLEGQDLADAQALFSEWHKATGEMVRRYLDTHPVEEEGQVRLHKSLINRLMEPAQEHTVVVTSTAWENFFRQRVSPLAQPEIKVAAEMMLDAYKQSTPRELIPGEWHLPYLESEDWEAMTEHHELGESMYPTAIKVSAARCARVSYLTQDGKRDIGADLDLYERLVTAEPMHASPLEHVATPDPWNVHEVEVRCSPVGTFRQDTRTLLLPKVGNLLGWRQHRLDVELTRDYQFFA